MVLSISELSPRSIVRPREGVLARVVGGEMVVLDVGRGLYYGLNEVGTLAWTLWLEGLTLGEVEARLTAAYEVDAETLCADLLRLLNDLIANGLIDVAAG